MDLLRSLMAVLEAVDQGIHVVDERGVTVVYNRAASVIDGLAVHEVMGQALLDIFPSLNEHSSTLLRVLKTGLPEPEKQQTFTNFKGKKVTTVNFTHPIVLDGQLVGACEVSTDITRLKEMAERIVDLQKELEARLPAPRSQRRPPKGATRQLFILDDIVGESAPMREAKHRALQVAESDSSVLVWGETGTGKELLVQAIHSASQRSGGPFVPQNSAALPESLLESIVFGTVRGSFTGSMDRPGLFELASGGTLYLDEIDSMPLGLQAKLLRAIQDKRVRRLGGTRERPVDVRIVASTSTKPKDALAGGSLRPDLYYRLSVVEISLPPLRERREDIPLLCDAFLAKHARQGAVAALTAEAMAAFMAYEWPGNVRELEHAIEGGVALAKDGIVDLQYLPQSVKGAFTSVPQWNQNASEEPLQVSAQHSPSLKHALREREKAAIRRALKEAGSVAAAARLLGIPRQTLQYKMKILKVSK